ncbi:mediator of RNA polymerase II transcription subunit 16 [Pyrus ussuriensis x Pyrus communis]|uniref:Mediator of RNA polymerase II transcription subunit 16 n=1 Tax=Pyrus ussuriensis x Pyrus communis TaxID=2448454 RepID=A0A5N5FJY9_9ROSA|nr:mediator of RNA polymerase II transcription subunit 16 [Pyrus ussuriensis x Pyrus communis]
MQNMPRPIGADAGGLLLELHLLAKEWHWCNMYRRQPRYDPDDMSPQDDSPKLCNSSDPPDSES